MDDLGAPAVPADPGNLGAAQPRLLIVDDDHGCAQFLSHAAFECGHEPTIMASAEDFQRRYRDAQPDVVVLDLAMPGVDGVELLRFLAEQRCTSRIILTSGVPARVLEAAMRFGQVLGLNMGPPLPKPFVVQELAEALAAPPTGSGREDLSCFH
jgi:DNA-binding response OmpR family regulator